LAEKAAFDAAVEKAVQEKLAQVTAADQPKKDAKAADQPKEDQLKRRASAAASSCRICGQPAEFCECDDEQASKPLFSVDSSAPEAFKGTFVVVADGLVFFVHAA